MIFQIQKKVIFGPINFLIVFIGISGIAAILSGLNWTHRSLADPSSTMEVIYDLVVLGSLPMWRLVEKLFKIEPKTKIRSWDVLLHIFMALLVATRVWIHWKEGWNIFTFLPASLAVSGYWAFNIAMRFTSLLERIIINIVAGLIFIFFAIILGGTALTITHWTFFGAMAIMAIVLGVNKAYSHLDTEGLKALVIPAIYDGLLILAPLVLAIFYRQHFGVPDWLISLGFCIVFSLRAFLYKKERDQDQARRQLTPS